MSRFTFPKGTSDVVMARELRAAGYVALRRDFVATGRPAKTSRALEYERARLGNDFGWPEKELLERARLLDLPRWEEHWPTRRAKCAWPLLEDVVWLPEWLCPVLNILRVGVVAAKLLHDAPGDPWNGKLRQLLVSIHDDVSEERRAAILAMHTLSVAGHTQLGDMLFAWMNEQ